MNVSCAERPPKVESATEQCIWTKQGQANGEVKEG